jgi:hypothetical protein
LARLPNLTHLAAPYSMPSTIDPDSVRKEFPGILESDEAPVLEMVVLTVDLIVEKPALSKLGQLLAAVDERLYVVHAPTRVDLVKAMWDRSSRGGETLWDQAIREREQVS